MGISRSQVALRQIFRRNVVVKARNNAVVGQDRSLPSRSDLRFEIDDHVSGSHQSVLDVQPTVDSAANEQIHVAIAKLHAAASVETPGTRTSCIWTRMSRAFASE